MTNRIQHIIESRTKDLGGGMMVSRVLPFAKKRMVGPFIFLDHMGPVHFDKDHKMTVNPHPHIGLSTLTYLFKGRIHHHDSLGSSAIIVPGEVNWMTAGKGISHSEKTPEDDLGNETDVHGLQFWVALPDDLEEMEPSFENYKTNEIPKVESTDATIDVVVGNFADKVSPVKAYSPVTFINIKAKNDFYFVQGENNFELALFLIEGSMTIDGKIYENHELIVFERGSKIEATITKGSHCALIGGEPFLNPKFIWWNFVSSSKEKMKTARDNWNEGNFPQVPNEGNRLFAPLEMI
ncbi:MAG: pirin family protein [Rhizobacter sp.]|nr:pirin family protein [Bacteriovorax sp.]